MKKLFLYLTFILLTIFSACNKQEIEDNLIPVNQDQPTLSAQDAANVQDHTIATNDFLTSDFTIDNENGQVDESEKLLLTNKSVNAVSYEWDFGNGNTSTEANPTYRYKIHGNYTVTLKATDALGNTQQTSQDIVVLCIFGGGNHDQ
jgi:PKD repeat protein